MGNTTTWMMWVGSMNWVEFWGDLLLSGGTRYSDGGLSLASEEVCGRIRKDIPVMTRASIGSTGRLTIVGGVVPPMN